MSTTHRATLADVARLAGVSAKTVSRVFAGEDKVTARTKEKVLGAAHQLHYTPNLLARDLRRGGASQTMALVTSEVDNAYFADVVLGVERRVRADGFSTVMAVADARDQRAVVGEMQTRRVQALLIVPSGDDFSFLEGERASGTAIIAVDRPLPNLLSDSVVHANREGGRTAARVLLDHGHRRIAYLTHRASIYTQRERVAGVREMLSMRGGVLVDTGMSNDSGVSPTDLAAAVLDAAEPATALICGDNQVTAGALRAMARGGWGAALIGFDDFELADVLGVSVIAHSPLDMGAHAAQLAVARLGDPTGVPRQIVLPMTYIPRGSGERPPRAR